ncbi:MAG: hypothetical protein LBT87_00865 [Treponema sp.]|jgi:hypothetical protein|nr:hypothetical protein [Treponema sp.]
MSVFQKLLFVCLVVSFAVFSSCAARISGELRQGGAANFTVSTGLEPRMSSLIRSFAAMAGGEAGARVLNGEALSRSLSAAPGVESAVLRNTGPAALEGPVKITNIRDFLAPARDKKGFIVLEENASGGRLRLTLNRDLGPDILSLISPEVGDYLSALMAPIATGEILSKTEYLELVVSIYGEPIADEISKAAIRASVDFPGQVRSVRGGKFSGKRAEFDIPLLDILVLESPLVYEVAWN